MEEAGLTLNKAKCEFSKGSLRFFGHIFSGKGMRPDPEKVEALNSATPPPVNTTDLSSFLGLASYCCRYLKDYATVSNPLRLLTRKDTPFVWSKECQEAFKAIRSAISQAEDMAYFDAR
ncbi:uncharacterized protein [Ambystoma mexicanum]|uniref:uncharacterized protein n=1 Tax=Ambystoma mexicanum TaxID=8296 RepID=UPI0037E76EFA